jgi:transcriptional regulator with GAF, ATPase, and Fis domain
LDSLASEATKRLFEILKPERVGLYSTSPDGEPELLRGYARESDAGGMRRLESREISGARLELMVQAIRCLEPSQSLLRSEAASAGSEDACRTCYAVPLTQGDSCIGVIYLEGDEEQRELDASDMLFLRSLGLQLAMAIDRIRLAEREVQRQESEKRLLRAELNELRQAVQRAKLVYRSEEMESLMTMARRVAGTDATVLITGPSGTGKELLARTMHELSPRRDKEFVIVDCGAIPTTLIESELFGHEKGAYTGADRRSAGLIAKAAGGTVLLDEIGELPLTVQTKLLRFVQDKAFTSVGGNQTRKVDVRILAATNRQLENDVAAGRFREDLYYRLNVVHLEVPALAERPGDIMLLARHFLELYAVQYQKSVRGFSDEAGLSLVNHGWPGNVRELQNRLMQAVLLCDKEVLTPTELNLEGSRGARTVLAFSSAREDAAGDDSLPVGSGEASPAPDAPGSVAPRDHADVIPGESIGALIDGLRTRLGAEISAVAVDSEQLQPLGRWLNEELLLVADEAADGGLNRGARIVGIAPSTYRRRLRKAKEAGGFAQSPNPEEWTVVRDILQRLVTRDTDGQTNLQAVTEQALLNEILLRYPGNTRVGSALMGVTPPTFRSRVAELNSAQAIGADR